MLQGIGELAFRFQELAEQASLYAQPDTYTAVRGVLDGGVAVNDKKEEEPDEDVIAPETEILQEGYDQTDDHRDEEDGEGGEEEDTN
jgi:hypothetical protein